MYHPEVCRCNDTWESPPSDFAAHSFQELPYSQWKCHPWGYGGPIMQHQTPEMPAQECLSLEWNEGRWWNQDTRFRKYQYFNYNSTPTTLVLHIPWSFPAKETNVLPHLGWPPMVSNRAISRGVQPRAGRYNLKPDFLRKRSKPIIMTWRILWPHFLCLCLQIKALCEWLYTHMQTKIHTSVGFCLYTDANPFHSLDLVLENTT